VDKDPREKMKGKHYAELGDAQQAVMVKYAAVDAVNCHRLWVEHEAKWPEPERRISRLNRECGVRGVAIDVPKLLRYIEALKQVIWEAGRKIPWEWDKTPLSHNALRLECRKAGIPAPASLAADDPGCVQWEDDYGGQFPWVAAMRDWRRLDRLNRTIGTLAAAFQMDLRPALASAAFFVIRPARPADPPALLHAGEALQRFWLTATELGLGFQPALATLIFADHGARGTEFSAAPGLAQRAATLAERFRATLGDPREVVFMGRLGAQPPGIPGPRSVRRPLDDLMQPGF
jgi:hypothetical protein